LYCFIFFTEFAFSEMSAATFLLEIKMADGTQHALSRIRPPRVQVTYDVETGGAIEKKELPFIVGVMADLAGKSHEDLAPLPERKFAEIDRDNLNEVMASIKPTVALSVPNTISEDGGNLNVELTFRSMEDFNPVNVIKKVKPLKELYEARSRLNDLLAKLDGNDDLDQLLGDVVSNTERQKEMKEAVAEIQASDPVDEESEGSNVAPEGDDS
jgi:type VI secretion system protein ImpB